MTMTPNEDAPTSDPQEARDYFTICQYCGVDLLWHRCAEGERAERERGF